MTTINLKDFYYWYIVCLLYTSFAPGRAHCQLFCVDLANAPQAWVRPIGFNSKCQAPVGQPGDREYLGQHRLYDPAVPGPK